MPFVKWAGGKRSLIPAISAHIPDHVERYWEPFVGGGALFFALAERIGQAVLSDTNEDLVITYQMVKTNVECLIARLSEHDRNHRRRKGLKYRNGETYYVRVRASEPSDPIEVAARLIYLNRTCFNGLYRVNRSGRFNVPEGSYKNPDICNAERLRSASKALERAHIRLGDFERVVSPSRGDLIYCDPPYDGTFTGYQADGFPGTAQRRLRISADRWRESGARVILSNADTMEMRKLYDAYTVEEVAAPRNINSDANGRSAAPELLIRG